MSQTLRNPLPIALIGTFLFSVGTGHAQTVGVKAGQPSAKVGGSRYKAVPAAAVNRASSAQAASAAQTTAPATAQPNATAASAAAQDEEEAPRRRRFRIGPQLGIFFPTSEKTRDRFGNGWVEFGVGFGPVQEAEEAAKRGRTTFSLNVMSKSRGDNRATLVPIGVGYRKSLSTGQFSPYVGGSGHLLLADLRVPSEGIGSGIRAGGGVSGVVGTAIGDSAFVEAQYFLFSRIKGYDFSGLELKGGVRF